MWCQTARGYHLPKKGKKMSNWIHMVSHGISMQHSHTEQLCKKQLRQNEKPIALAGVVGSVGGGLGILNLPRTPSLQARSDRPFQTNPSNILSGSHVHCDHRRSTLWRWRWPNSWNGPPSGELPLVFQKSRAPQKNHTELLRIFL